MTARLLAALFIALATPSAQAAIPSVIEMSYNGYLGGVHVAMMNERFEAAGGRYHIVSETAPVGFFKLFQPRAARFVSRGRVTARGLQPEYFEGSRGPDDPRRASAEFDWENRRLALSHDGRNDVVELPAGTQDRLSIMYQLMYLVNERTARLEFAMTNGRKLDRYRYEVVPDAEIDTPLGRMKAVHLVRQRDAGESQTELWLAPQFHYLPVRMILVESDGTRYEQIVTRIDLGP